MAPYRLDHSERGAIKGGDPFLYNDGRADRRGDGARSEEGDEGENLEHFWRLLKRCGSSKLSYDQCHLFYKVLTILQNYHEMDYKVC